MPQVYSGDVLQSCSSSDAGDVRVEHARQPLSRLFCTGDKFSALQQFARPLQLIFTGYLFTKVTDVRRA